MQVNAVSRSTNDTRIARIVFSRPGRLVVIGSIGSKHGNKYGLLFNGRPKSYYAKGKWSADNMDAESAIAAVSGVSLGTASTLPALLFHVDWGHIGINDSKSAVSVMRERALGHDAYRIHEGGKYPQDLWIDQKTYLLLKTREKTGGYLIQTEYSGYQINKMIPASRFQR
jgi:hypothetical protein